MDDDIERRSTYPETTVADKRPSSECEAQYQKETPMWQVPGRQPVDTDRASSSQSANPRDFEPLSPREIEVLDLIVRGYSNRAVAEALIIGQNTVKMHVRNIYRKLDVHNRALLVRRATELRYI
jgi:DNA-binding NarL/FixJ family response regulator